MSDWPLNDIVEARDYVVHNCDLHHQTFDDCDCGPAFDALMEAHDKEVLDKAVERADRALDRYFEDYRIEGQRAVLAAVRGEGEQG